MGFPSGGESGIEQLCRPVLRFPLEIRRQGSDQFVHPVLKCSRITVDTLNPFFQDVGFVNLISGFADAFDHGQRSRWTGIGIQPDFCDVSGPVYFPIGKGVLQVGDADNDIFQLAVKGEQLLIHRRPLGFEVCLGVDDGPERARSALKALSLCLPGELQLCRGPAAGLI